MPREFNGNKQLHTIDLHKANKVALIYWLGFFVFFSAIYLLIWGTESPAVSYSFWHFLWYPLYFIFGILLHEAVHGVFFALFAKEGFKSVKFGVLWKYLAPYAHCKEPLRVPQYTIALLSPLVVTGLVPALYALIIGDYFLLLVAIILCAGAAGDLMIYNLIRKIPKNYRVKDHPTDAGFWLYLE